MSTGYPPESRAEAERLCRIGGRGCKLCSRELGISLETLMVWVRQADIDEGRADGSVTASPPPIIATASRSNPARVLPRPGQLRRRHKVALSGLMTGLVRQ